MDAGPFVKSEIIQSKINFSIVERSENAVGAILKQVHGIQGWERTEANCRERLEGDWHYTHERDLPLVICVADCTAILLEGKNERGPFVAALHAGWRGTAAGIIENAIEVLKIRAVQTREIRAWLSPAICQKHFEVGPEVIDAFGADGRDFSSTGRGDRRHLDLKGLQKRRLENAGVTVELSPLCTFCEESFISYRRDGPALTRRMAFSITQN